MLVVEVAIKAVEARVLVSVGKLGDDVLVGLWRFGSANISVRSNVFDLDVVRVEVLNQADVVGWTGVLLLRHDTLATHEDLVAERVWGLAIVVASCVGLLWNQTIARIECLIALVEVRSIRILWLNLHAVVQGLKPDARARWHFEVGHQSLRVVVG